MTDMTDERTGLAVYMDALARGQIDEGEYMSGVDRMLCEWSNDHDRLAAAERAHMRRDLDARHAKRVALRATLRDGNLRERVLAAAKLGVWSVEVLARDRIPNLYSKIAWPMAAQQSKFFDVDPASLSAPMVPGASKTMTARIRFTASGVRCVDVTTLTVDP